MQVCTTFISPNHHHKDAAVVGSLTRTGIIGLLKRFVTASKYAITACALGALALTLASDWVMADPVPATAPANDYSGQDVMIRMRDGVRLHAQVWRPAAAAEALPILMARSPYGFKADHIRAALAFGGPYHELAADKYILVFEDLRGRFGSEGKFVNLRPMDVSSSGTTEATDTYDTIDWLVKHMPRNNGRVGVLGVSYGGWTAAIATIDPHPALKAVSSQASPDDMFIGDDFLHNGAFRLDYGWSWVSALETDGHTMKTFDFGADDAYGWYLKQHDIANLDKQKLGETLPSWQTFVDHPTYDEFWKSNRTSKMMPATVAVPNLIVAGWWDQEDFYGPLKIWTDQEKNDPKNLDRLVIGPWNHGGWRGEGAAYGPYALGSKTGVWFRTQIELPWFRYWLKNAGPLELPKAYVFQSGSNRWQGLDSWPADEGTAMKTLYFHANGKLSFAPPAASEARPDSFRSDPADPVPYRERAVLKPLLATGSTWSTWLADDQASFAKRADVLFWQTDPLTQDVTISGNIAAELFASTTGTDADWVVKLIDVYPCDNFVPAEIRCRQRMIANDVFRGRYRASYDVAKPLTPEAVLGYTIDLHSASHVFKKDHRIAVQVQSSWFPLIDRNPQTFVPNIYRATPADYKAETHAVYHTPAYASGVSVHVAPTTP